MRSLGSYKNEVSLPKHELDLIYASILCEFFQVTFERRDSIADAGFVADALISRKVLRDFFVIPSDVNGLVVFPDNRFILFRVLREFCLSWPIGLSVPALVGWGVRGGEGPMLDDQAVLEPEDVEEDVAAGSLPLRLGNDVRPILECPDHGQLELVTWRLADELHQPLHTGGRVRIVLHKPLMVDVLRRSTYVPGADAGEHSQDSFDVARCLPSILLSRPRKAFDPLLVIAVERTGILAPEFFKEEGALLRLLG